MTADIGPRLVTLLVIGVFGIGFVLVGPSLGIAPPVLDADQGMTVTVSENNVTVDDGGQSAVVAENIETAETIKVTRSEGRITVQRDDSLTERERTRAREITRSNETVQNHLAEMSGFELAVEPIVRIDDDAIQATNVDSDSVETNDTTSGKIHQFERENTSVQQQGNSVTIHRNRSYVADRAVVRIREPNTDEVRYTVRVDLANGTVTDLYTTEPVTVNTS